MKKIVPMMCPICKKMYFEGPIRSSYKEDLDEYLNGEVQCRFCGWIYDFDQFKNPDSHDGFNTLSLNEYKKLYEDKIRTNPNYDYLEEKMPKPIPHKCPICGEFVFKDEDCYDICDVCGWEDDGYYSGGGANDMSLDEAIEHFKSKRKEDANYKWINEIQK